MTISRYSRSPILRGGRLIGSSNSAALIYRGVQNGVIDINIQVLRADQRLDQIAGEVYGDGRLWWVIAAASGIGWAPQCPGGTVLSIPTDIVQIGNLVG